MALRRREVELCVERPLGPDRPGGTVRLSARFEVSEDGEGPAPADLARELDRLTADLDALVGAPIAAVPIGRAERDLTELVETYRPRQRELIDLLRDEGELTTAEHARLVEYLTAAPEGRSREPAPPPTLETERLIATVPIEREIPVAPGRAAVTSPFAPAKPGENARPVPELLQTYQISNLRQAGAVRARRQISFGEYMALKRHFEDEETRARTRRPEGPR
jgi:hypothetical protein